MEESPVMISHLTLLPIICLHNHVPSREITLGVHDFALLVTLRLVWTVVCVRDISYACEQQQGTIPFMSDVCNVDYIVDISRSDRIAREHFRFLEHRF